jgi:DNA-binding GntR family transcriptional regulator
LKMEPGYPVLTSVRTAYDTAGRPIEYGSYSYPAEAYSLGMVLTGP